MGRKCRKPVCIGYRKNLDSIRTNGCKILRRNSYNFKIVFLGEKTGFNSNAPGEKIDKGHRRSSMLSYRPSGEMIPRHVMFVCNAFKTLTPPKQCYCLARSMGFRGVYSVLIRLLCRLTNVPTSNDTRSPGPHAVTVLMILNLFDTTRRASGRSQTALIFSTRFSLVNKDQILNENERLTLRSIGGRETLFCTHARPRPKLSSHVCPIFSS